MTFSIKQNDTGPAMLATLQDASGAAVNITGALVRFHMRQIGSTQVKVDAAVTIVSPLDGAVRYNWIAADTDTIGSYQAEFEVTYADASIETFPNDGYIRVEIIDDIT
jgi:hypothetical protein